MSKLADNGIDTIFYKGTAQLIHENAIIATAKEHKGQYWLYASSTAQLNALFRSNQVNVTTIKTSGENISKPISIELAHRRACHAGERRVRKMQTHSEGVG